MTTSEDRALTDSVEKLNDTATSLTALMKIVDKNQRLLVENQEATLENTDAISLRSTKDELLTEVARLAIERKKDRTKTKLTVGGSFFMSLLLILAIFLTTAQYKNARSDANSEYTRAAQNVCLQRSATWDAMQNWITTQRSIEIANPYINESFRAKRVAALNELLNAFPDVDCSIGSNQVGLPVPTGLGYQENSAFASIK